MDPITHAVIGSAVAALAPADMHTAITWGVVIGAEIPDIDFILRYTKGHLTYLRNHRGPTHGLAVLPLEAALIAVVLRLIWPSVPFWPLFGWTLLGCLSHVLFDFGNDYGTQGLWPFSSRRIALDFIPIVDLNILGIIGAGWLVDGFWGGHRPTVFAGVWLLLCGYAGYRWLLRRAAYRLVAEKLDVNLACGDYAPCGADWQEEQLTIHPSLLSLQAWRYALQRPGEFYIGTVWVDRQKVGAPQKAQNHYDLFVKASLKSQTIAAFARWARRPRAEVTEEGGIYKVQWTDVRYEVDGFSPFAAYAYLDDELTLVDDRLGTNTKPKSGEIKRRLRREMGREDG